MIGDLTRKRDSMAKALSALRAIEASAAGDLDDVDPGMLWKTYFENIAIVSILADTPGLFQNAAHGMTSDELLAACRRELDAGTRVPEGFCKQAVWHLRRRW